jgi:hypothetical protein
MESKVRINKNQLDYFRRLARNTNLEIQAYLIGEIVSPKLTVVDEVVYPKQGYGLQTTSAVAWWVEELTELRRRAEERGKRVVGHIHSHPSWDAVMSEADYKLSVEESLRLCGICSTQGRKTRVRFWTTSSALPCDIEYAKVSGSR